MARGSLTLGYGLLVLVIAVVAFFVLAERGAFDVEVWERNSPLVDAFSVSSVREGVITLTDGRPFRPAGVSRREGVSADDYDHALRVIVAQGVTVTRDLGDARAFLLAEPRFYNWCGTRGYKGNPWARWAGSYLQCPVSELLIQTAYARAQIAEPGLTPRERWRLEGIGQSPRIDDSPVHLSDDLNALIYDADLSLFADFETKLEMLWKPPPPP